MYKGHLSYKIVHLDIRSMHQIVERLEPEVRVELRFMKK